MSELEKEYPEAVPFRTHSQSLIQRLYRVKRFRLLPPIGIAETFPEKVQERYCVTAPTDLGKTVYLKSVTYRILLGDILEENPDLIHLTLAGMFFLENLEKDLSAEDIGSAITKSLEEFDYE